MAASSWLRAAVILLCAFDMLLVLPPGTGAAEDPSGKPGEAAPPPPKKKKKDIRDYNDADMARLLEQWEVCGARPCPHPLNHPGHAPSLALHPLPSVPLPSDPLTSSLPPLRVLVDPFKPPLSLRPTPPSHCPQPAFLGPLISGQPLAWSPHLLPLSWPPTLIPPAWLLMVREPYKWQGDLLHSIPEQWRWGWDYRKDYYVIFIPERNGERNIHERDRERDRHGWLPPARPVLGQSDPEANCDLLDRRSTLSL